MDGTIANFYAVENWEKLLQNEDIYPYSCARPLFSMKIFTNLITKLQENGYKIGIISWTSMDSSEKFHKEVTKAKKDWLARHLGDVNWNAIHIVEYGTPKEIFEKDCAILFDDNESVRRRWTGIAFDEKNILKNLERLVAVR